MYVHAHMNSMHVWVQLDVLLSGVTTMPVHPPWLVLIIIISFAVVILWCVHILHAWIFYCDNVTPLYGHIKNQANVLLRKGWSFIRDQLTWMVEEKVSQKVILKEGWSSTVIRGHILQLLPQPLLLLLLPLLLLLLL